MVKENFKYLFLDRDGVINKRLIGDYVKKVEEFEFLPGVLDILPQLNTYFKRTFIVTNQQGIGKGLMTHEDLKKVHDYFQAELIKTGGKIDAFYYAPQLASENSIYRKPNNGMALKAKEEFSEIDFSKSILVGDSISDIEFGKKSGMLTVYLHPQNDNSEAKADYVFASLIDFGTFFLKS